MRASWQGVVLAASDKTVLLEGNHCFPADSVERSYLRDSSTHTTCSWNGEASYYDLIVDGNLNKDAAWYYPVPKDAAKDIAEYVAFWRGVEVVE